MRPPPASPHVEASAGAPEGAVDTECFGRDLPAGRDRLAAAISRARMAAHAESTFKVVCDGDFGLDSRVVG